MNKLTETSNGEKKGKGCQGTFMKDTLTKPKGGRIRVGGGDEWMEGHGGMKMEITVFEQ